MKTNESVAKQYSDYVLSTYGREGLVFEKGIGSYLFDISGDKYLDMYPGWGTGCLGHCHPHIIKSLTEQLNTLIHIPNNFYNPWQADLAQRLAEHGFYGHTFFCNSGAEATEAAIKLARRFGNQNGRFEIITFYKSFHGRTLAAITATAQEKYQQGFQPLPEGFKYVEFNNIDALRDAVTAKTCAIMFEPIQGEGGVNVACDEFYKGVQELCDKHNLLMILDEVQTGVGRTGNFYGYQTFRLKPDVVTLAKALGGGIPIGAMMVKPALKDMLPPGMHASTYGGNPIACRAGLAVMEVFESEDILGNVKTQSEFMVKELNRIKDDTGFITGIRGKGLMVGVDLNISAMNVKQKCREQFVLINAISDTTIRFLPALNIGTGDLSAGLEAFKKALLKEGAK